MGIRIGGLRCSRRTQFIYQDDIHQFHRQKWGFHMFSSEGQEEATFHRLSRHQSRPHDLAFVLTCSSPLSPYKTRHFCFFFQLIDPWRPKRRTAAVELRADVTQSIVRQPFSWRAPDHRQHGKAGAQKGGLGARNPVVKTCFKASFSLPKWPLQMGGSPFSDTKNGLVHATAICRLIVHRYRLSIHSFYVYIHSFDSMYTYIIF